MSDNYLKKILYVCIFILVLSINSFVMADFVLSDNSSVSPTVTPSVTPIVTSVTPSNNYSVINSSIYSDIAPAPVIPNTYDEDYLSFMQNYWIPDLYDIKGRVDGSFSYNIPEIQNISLEYAHLRLTKNVNESRNYNISPGMEDLRQGYNMAATRTINIIDTIGKLNRSDPTYPDMVTIKTSPISLYATWLEYQVMKQYKKPDNTIPDLGLLESREFYAIMDNMTVPLN